MAEKKTPKHDTWMPFYVNDYFGATMTLTTEQHGAYMLLMLTAWKQGGKLPNDPVKLAQAVRLPVAQWGRLESVLRDYFLITPEFWIHEHVTEELAKAKANVEKKSAAGKVAAAKKWGLRVV